MSNGPDLARDADGSGGGHATGETWGALVFVYGVWALMLLAGLALVGRYGSSTPYLDDWAHVSVMIGEQPLTPRWLWAQHNEHRIPLQKVLLLTLVQLTEFDFRSGMIFTVLSLGIVALLLMRTARRVRGGTDYADAFFPLALLHWGHVGNLTFAFQVQHSSSMLLLGTLLAIIVTRGMKPGLGVGMLAGACLLLLPLSGAQGLAFVPALALWLGASAVLHASPWCSASRRAQGEALVLAGFAAAALLLVLCYFVGLERIAAYGPRPTLAATLETALALPALSFSPGYPSAWPYSGVAAAALLACSVVLLGTAVWRRPAAERLRALGLLFYLGGSVSLALGFGWGRAATNEDLTKLSSNYMLLAVPGLVSLYFAWVLYGPPAVRSLVPMALFTALTALTALNVEYGLSLGREHARGMEAFETDLLAGRPVHYLVARHKTALLMGIWDDEDLADAMGQMSRAGAGLFQHLEPDPPLDEVQIPVVPVALNEMEWEGEKGRGVRADSHMTFALPRPRYVAGVRIRYEYTNQGTALFHLAWRRTGAADVPEAPQHVREIDVGPSEQSATVYIADTIDQIRIHPDNKPFEVRIAEITLLIPKRR